MEVKQCNAFTPTGNTSHTNGGHCAHPTYTKTQYFNQDVRAGDTRLLGRDSRRLHVTLCPSLSV